MMFTSYLRNGSLVTVDVQVSDRAETNTSVLHHHCMLAVSLQVRASTVQSLAVLSLHEWHTLYYKYINRLIKYIDLESCLQSSPNECMSLWW